MGARETVAGEIEAMQALRSEMGPIGALEETAWVCRRGGVGGHRRNGKRDFHQAARLGYLEKQAGRWFVSAEGARALNAWEGYVTLSRYVSEVLR